MSQVVTQGSIPGLIEANTLYTLPELRARLRLGDWAWRKLKRRLDGNLPLIKIGNRKYAKGSAVIEALSALNEQPLEV